MKKVLILVPYSYPSKCGVWSRAYLDAKYLKSKGFDVTIFSSNILKGTNEKLPKSDEIDGIKILRFKVLFKLGGSSMFWFFAIKFLRLNPSIVHTHGFRHPHSLMSLILGKLTFKKVLLTTHAPFEKDNNRSIFLKIIDTLYDLIIARIELKLYNNVIRISNWEVPYLKKLGVKNSVFIPNGVNEIFNEGVTSPSKSDVPFKRVIFMGRLDPVKRLEWIINVAEQIETSSNNVLKDIKFLIRGSLNGYDSLESKSSNLTLDKTSYDYSEFIRELDTSDIYILPSIREALPYTLLEAMSRGKIVITSNSLGGLEVVKNGINGFIVSNETELREVLEYIYSNWDKMYKIRTEAINRALEYNINLVNEKLGKIYKQF